MENDYPKMVSPVRAQIQQYCFCVAESVLAFSQVFCSHLSHALRKRWPNIKVAHVQSMSLALCVCKPYKAEFNTTEADEMSSIQK